MADGGGAHHGLILALETSCDDTCAAVVREDGRIESNVIASRHHLELVDAVTADALERAGARLDDIDTVAVTRGPGLIATGSMMQRRWR